MKSWVTGHTACCQEEVIRHVNKSKKQGSGRRWGGEMVPVPPAACRIREDTQSSLAGDWRGLEDVRTAAEGRLSMCELILGYRY